MFSTCIVVGDPLFMPFIMTNNVKLFYIDTTFLYKFCKILKIDLHSIVFERALVFSKTNDYVCMNTLNEEKNSS